MENDKPSPVELCESTSESHFMTSKEELSTPVEAKEMVQPGELSIRL